MANPTLQLLIGGVDVSKYAVQDGWSITQNWGRQGGTAIFYLYDEYTTPSSPNVTPQYMQPIQLKDTTNGYTLFSGLITDPQWIYHSPNSNIWYLSCQDLTFYADMAVVYGQFTGQRADQILIQLTKQANVGIGTQYVQAGAVVPVYRVNYRPLSTVWSELALLSSASSSVSAANTSASQYGWFVDTSNQLHWYNANQAYLDPLVPSGVTFTDTVSGPSTTTLGYIAASSDMKYEWDATQMRNSCVVTGANITRTQVDTFIGNGSQSSWPLTFALSTNNPSFKVTVNGVSHTVASASSLNQTTSITNTPTSQPYFLAQQNNNGQWYLTVNQLNPSGFVLTAGSILEVGYNYTTPVLARADDLAQQNKIRAMLQKAGLPGSGIFQQYVSNTNITDVGTAQLYAYQTIQEYSQPQERFTFKTSDDFVGNIQAGQTFTLTSQYIPNSENGYARGMTGALFLAQQVTLTASQGKANYRQYQIVATRVS